MIFDQGFVHADPHPGNVMVDACPSLKYSRSSKVLLSSLTPKLLEEERRRCRLRVSLLDHGLYCALDYGFRECYAALWLALEKGDSEAVKNCTRRFGVSHLGDLLAVILSLRSPERLDRLSENCSLEAETSPSLSEKAECVGLFFSA